MAGLIDPSVLLGARGIQLPDPMALATQSLTLADLANRKRMHEYQMAQMARQDEAARALEGAMPGAIRAGFSDEYIAGADPRAQAGLLTSGEKYRKGKAETDKATAETAYNRAQTFERQLKMIGGSAFELAQKPDLSVNDVAEFYRGAQALGVPINALGMPQDESPEGLRQHLKGIANKSVGALDRLKLAGEAEQRGETGRHNRATEGLTGQRDARTAAHYDATEKHAAAQLDIARPKIGVDRATADAMMRGEPKEISVNGKPVLAIYDRKSGTFFDANTRQPISGGMAPKEPDIPASLREKMAQNEVTIANIDKALAMMDGKGGDAFGLKNYAPDAIVQRVDESGVELRALVSNLAGQKIHDRSGAAVTVGEMQRLRPYIPNIMDSPETVKKKLKLFRQEYVALQSEIARGRSLADIISDRSGSRSNAAAGKIGGPAPPKLGEVRDGYLYRGGDPADPKSWEKVR